MQGDIEALLAEVREHRDYLASRAVQLAVGLAHAEQANAELRDRIAQMESRLRGGGPEHE
jgi:hypothetical protein